MPTAESAAPFLYALLGACILLVLLSLWHYARSRRGKRSARQEFGVHLVDEISTSPAIDRQWVWDTLTEREMQVARLVAQGKRNAEIARDLSISIRTVETHLQHIYDKLQVRSRTRLARIIRDLVD